MKHAYLKLFTLALSVSLTFGGIAQPSHAADQKLYLNTPGAVMTHQEFEKWLHSHHLVDKSGNPTKDPIQLISINGSSETQTEKTLTAHVTHSSYMLGAGDQLGITVSGKPQFSREDVVVTTSGIVSMPYLGELQVTGKTTDQFRKELQERYSEYLVEPDVTVVVKKPRPQISYVLGAVAHPGSYLQVSKDANMPEIKGIVVTPDYRLITALANAGGIARDADVEHIYVFNDRDGYIKNVNLYELLVSGKVDQDVVLRPGDVVYVPKVPNPDAIDFDKFKLIASSTLGTQKFPVRIYGLVTRPDQYSLTPDEMTLQGALSKAGGPLYDANPKRVVIARPKSDGSLEKLIVDSTAGDTMLRPNDIVMVPDMKTSAKARRLFGAIDTVLRPGVNVLWGMSQIDRN